MQHAITYTFLVHGNTLTATTVTTQKYNIKDGNNSVFPFVCLSNIYPPNNNPNIRLNNKLKD